MIGSLIVFAVECVSTPTLEVRLDQPNERSVQILCRVFSPIPGIDCSILYISGLELDRTDFSFALCTD